MSKRCDCTDMRNMADDNARLREAIRDIMRGKVPSDNAHPQGAGWSMACRFMNIARKALAATDTPPATDYRAEALAARKMIDSRPTGEWRDPEHPAFSLPRCSDYRLSRADNERAEDEQP